jgi:hypothetical protein
MKNILELHIPRKIWIKKSCHLKNQGKLVLGVGREIDLMGYLNMIILEF